MELPEEILSITEKIKKSELNWKMRYCVCWMQSYPLKEELEKNPERGKDKVTLNLPAFKRKPDLTKEEYYKELTSNDIPFTLEHLVILFALFDELKTTASKILGKGETEKTSHKEELKLARETRNCYVHNGSRIDRKWIDAYKQARNKDAKEGERISNSLPEFYYQIEKWHDLIIELTDEIETKIKNTKATTPPRHLHNQRLSASKR